MRMPDVPKVISKLIMTIVGFLHEENGCRVMQKRMKR